jgi:hypothetical protein
MESEWTVSTLKEYVLALFAEKDRAVVAALASVKESALKNERDMEKRFEGVNEFRAQLADQQRTLMPRAEAELRLKNLEEAQAKRAGFSGGWVIAVAVVGFVSLLIGLFLTLRRV